MRIELLDILRGFSLVAMILFHANYLLLQVFHFAYMPISDLYMNTFGLIIALIFISISGYVNAMGYREKDIRIIFRKSLRRSALLAIVALGITLVTYNFIPEQKISWGIIHFFALATLVQPLFSRVGVWVFFYMFVPFFLSQVLSQISLDTVLFVPVGILFPGYFSADYYPLFPWFGVILFGQGVQFLFQKSHVEKWLLEQTFPKLSWLRFLGKHSLIVYVLHVPILFSIFSLLIFLL